MAGQGRFVDSDGIWRMAMDVGWMWDGLSPVKLFVARSGATVNTSRVEPNQAGPSRWGQFKLSYPADPPEPTHSEMAQAQRSV